MPTQDHINEIAGYLKSFEDGTRNHDQRFIHSACGSAHCLAGWKELDDAIARKDCISFRSEEGVKAIINGVAHRYANGWDYAAAVWELDEEEDEDYILFAPDLTLDEMKEGLRTIAAFHGLTCPI